MFKEIPEYPEYLINPRGEIFSTKSCKKLTHHINSAGYLYVSLYIEGRNKNLLVHRLLARVFKELPSLDSSLEVDHIDRDKLNLELDNLQVLSNTEHTRKTTLERGYSIGGKVCICPTCGLSMDKRSSKCSSCTRLVSSTTEDEIVFLVYKYGSWSAAARSLGLSDTALRKRYKIASGKDPKELTKQLRN